MIILRVRNRIVVLQLECIFILENGNPNELKLHLNSWDSFRLSLETGDKLDILRMSCLAKRKKNLTRNQKFFRELLQNVDASLTENNVSA